MNYRRFLHFVLLVFVVLLPLMVNPFILRILALAFAIGTLATSIDLTGGYSGLISLGQAGIMASSAYGVGIAATRYGLDFPLQILIGLLAAILVSVLFGIMIMRATGIQYLMVTLAQGMIIWGLSIRMTSITGGDNGIKGIERPPFLDGDIPFFYFSLGILVMALLIKWLITKSPLGLALRGLKDSDVRLNMIGYNIAFLKFYSFVLSGTLAGFAGIVLVYYNRLISPTAAGFTMSGKGVLAVLLGGLGTLIGPVLGAVIITFVENFLSGYVARWPTILGLIFVLAVLFARTGILGAIEGLTAHISQLTTRRERSSP